MIRTGWLAPERLGRPAHTGITARVGRPIDSFAHHVRLARPAEVYDQASVGSCVAQSLALAGGVSWGVFRTQLERQREELGDLRREVRELRTTVQDLTTKLAVVADRHDREHAT